MGQEGVHEQAKRSSLNSDTTEGEVKEDSTLAKALKRATKAQEKTKQAVASIANLIFQLYANFLTEKACWP